jgi:hypothetical protein
MGRACRADGKSSTCTGNAISGSTLSLRVRLAGEPPQHYFKRKIGPGKSGRPGTWCAPGADRPARARAGCRPGRSRLGATDNQALARETPFWGRSSTHAPSWAGNPLSTISKPNRVAQSLPGRQPSPTSIRTGELRTGAHHD